MPFDFPGAPNPGDVFTDPTSAASFTWNGYAWMGGAANSLGALIVSDTPPSAPANNSLWFESDTGMLFIRYNDGNSSQWVQVNALPNGAGYMPLQGVTDGSNAPAGQIGEVISGNVGMGAAITTNTVTVITSIVLTPGDWDVQGEVWFTLGTGGATSVQAGTSTSATALIGQPGPATSRASINCAMAASSNVMMPLRTSRLSLTGTVTHYLLGVLGFPSGSCVTGGNLWARRVR